MLHLLGQICQYACACLYASICPQLGIVLIESTLVTVSWCEIRFGIAEEIILLHVHYIWEIENVKEKSLKYASNPRCQICINLSDVRMLSKKHFILYSVSFQWKKMWKWLQEYCIGWLFQYEGGSWYPRWWPIDQCSKLQCEILHYCESTSRTTWSHQWQTQITHW